MEACRALKSYTVLVVLRSAHDIKSALQAFKNESVKAMYAAHNARDLGFTVTAKGLYFKSGSQIVFTTVNYGDGLRGYYCQKILYDLDDIPDGLQELFRSIIRTPRDGLTTRFLFRDESEPDAASQESEDTSAMDEWLNRFPIGTV